MFAGLLNKGFRGSLAVMLLLFVLGLAASLFSPVALENNTYPDLFYNYFTQNLRQPQLVTLLNFLCIAIGLMLMSMITSNQEIVNKQNYIPVFLYLMICLATVSPTQLSPQIFTNVLILIAFYMLLDVYRSDKAMKSLFEAAFWLSCSSFISVSSILALPLFFTALLILRPFYWREWAMAMLGFLSPQVIYEGLAYLLNWNQWFLPDAVGLYLDYMKAPLFSEYFFPLLAIQALLLVMTIIDLLLHGTGNTVKKQRSKIIFLWFMFYSLFGFFSAGSNSSLVLLICAVPYSFLVGDFLYHMRVLRYSNSLLSLFMLSVLLVMAGKLGWL